MAQDEGVIAGMEPANDDVAALDQPEPPGHRLAGGATHVIGPRPSGVDHDAGADLAGRACRLLERAGPRPATALERGQPGPGQDIGAVPGGVDGSEHHEPGIVDRAIGIGETGLGGDREAAAPVRIGEVDTFAAGQRPLSAEPVVEPEAEADQPRRAHAGAMGQHEAQRMDDVGRGGEQDLAFIERLADEAELVLLEIAQATVDQLARGRRRRLGEIAALDQQYVEAASRRVARDAGAVDPAADDQQVVPGFHRLTLPILGNSHAIFVFRSGCELALIDAARRA